MNYKYPLTIILTAGINKRTINNLNLLLYTISNFWTIIVVYLLVAN